jgi:hypothetical protein
MPEVNGWYEQIIESDSLMQGDLIQNCPFVIPPEDMSAGSGRQVDIITYKIVILSQSCDLEWEKIDKVLVCPFATLTEMETMYPQFGGANFKESIKRGYQPSYLLLNKLEGDFLLIDFREAYSVPLKTLKDIARANSVRWRLRPPYREYLSQNFAKFFMRIGLLDTIPTFERRFDIDYCDKCPVYHTSL